MDKQTLYIVGIGIAVVIVGFVIYKILQATGLIKSAESEAADELANDAAFREVASNIKNQPEFLRAIRAKFGSKPTAAQMLSLTPNKAIYGALGRQIMEAHNNWTPNNAGKIFGVYKQLKSQYEANFFNTVFGMAIKSDAYAYLDKLMHDSDMATLRKIILAKPLI